MTNLFNKISQDLASRGQQLKFINTTPVDEIQDGEPRTLISALYADEDNVAKLYGSFWNMIFTNKCKKFMFSYSIARDLVSRDRNLSGFELAIEEYKNFMSSIKDNQIIKCIVEPTKGSEGIRRAGIYELIEAEVLEEIQKVEVHEEEEVRF